MRTRRGVAVVALLAAAAAFTTVGPAAPVGAAPLARQTPGAACTENPFTSGFGTEVRRRWPAQRFTAAIYDSVTGCEYTYNPGQRITTASVFKAQILAGLVLRAQREGRGLTAWERANAGPMITYSADPEASALWRSLGGQPGMEALDRTLGLTQTTAATPWGVTWTTAHDRNLVLRQMLWGYRGLFTGSSRMTARAFMLNVTPSQRWGVPTGVPSTWKVPMKNGFFTSQCCRWRLNTSGVVERPGRGQYALTVLSDGWPTDDPGIAAVSYISGVVADWAAATAGPHPSAARAVHRSYHDVLGRAPTYAEERRGSDRIGTSGRGGPDLVTGLIGSSELDRHVGVLLRLYLGGLGAMPSAEAYDRRAWQLRTGRLTPAALGDEIVAAQAFNGGVPLSDPDFVDLVVERTLGRTPSAEANARWVAELQGGMTRGAVLLHFADSAEARWVRYAPVKVGEVWSTLLRRPPSADDLALWAARIAGGTPTRAVVGMVFGSAEHVARWR